MTSRNITATAVLFFFALMFSGCLGHRGDPPTILERLPASYSESREAGDDDEAVSLQAPWWRSVDDAVLTSLLEQTLEGNFDLAIAEAKLSQALAQARITGASRWPTATVTAGVARQKTQSLGGFSGTQSTGGTIGPLTYYSETLAASYEVDLWGKIRSRRAAALDDVEATREDLHAAMITVTGECAELYFQLRETQMALSLVDRSITAYEESLDIVRNRYLSGLTTIIDVYQARQNVLRAEAQKPQLLKQRTRLLNALAVFIGQFPDQNRFEARDIFPLTWVTSAPVTGIPADLLLARPDLRAQLIRLRAADQRIAEAVADRLPSLSISASTGISSTDSGALTSIDNLVWSLVGNLVGPLIDGGRRKAEVDRRRAARDEAVALFSKKLVGAVGEVEEALVQKNEQEKLVKLLEDRRDLLVENVQVALDRYRLGLTGYLNVLSAQASLFDVELSLTSAYREQASISVRLMRSLGGSWPGQSTRIATVTGPEVSPDPVDDKTARIHRHNSSIEGRSNE